jgi:hypothetical protein
MSMSGPGELVTSARLLRIEIFPPSVACEGSRVAAGAIAEISRSFPAGESLKLDLPPGRHTVALTAFGDAAGTVAIGYACASDDFAPGAKLCLDLTLVAAPDAAIPDGDVDLGLDAATDSGADLADLRDAGGEDGPVCGSGPACTPSQACCGGTCVDLQTSILNCGACGRVCSSTGVATASCAGGLCTSSCLGFAGNCSRPPAPLPDDGCETDLDSSVNSCGACGRACSSSNVLAKHCAGGVCDSTCSGTFGNCARPTGASADDGCEVNLDTSTAHCGACGRACSNSGVASPACQAARCTSTCSGNGLNCNQPLQPFADDGCEANRTSTMTCAACGNLCTATNASAPTCNGTRCAYTCNGGFVDCTAAANVNTNGCECEGNGCCPGNTCQVKHNNGQGQSYFDCVPLATYNAAQAVAACRAYAVNPANCDSNYFCGPMGTPTHLMACNGDMNGETDCACWVFGGSDATALGRTFNNPSATGCFCPTASHPSWN